MKKKSKNEKVVEAELIKNVNEDTDQVRKFVIILAGVAIIALLLYLLSSKVLIKDGIKTKESVAEEISYDTVDVGNVFNRPYDEYYVLAFDSDSLKANRFSMLMDNAGSLKGKIYFLDLRNEINKRYVKDEGNSKATKASELSLKEPTLIKISKGKISKYLETAEEIEKELR